MKLYFVTNDLSRYKELISLLPYETQLILYKKKYSSLCKNIEMILLDHKFEGNMDTYFVLDELRYEIPCLNNFPGQKTEDIFNIEIEVIRKICRLRNNYKINQVTVFEIYDYELNLIKEIRSEVGGDLVMEGSIRTIDDLFLPNYFDKPYSKIDIEERARIGSLTMAAKALIDWAESPKS